MISTSTDYRVAKSRGQAPAKNNIPNGLPKRRKHPVIRGLRVGLSIIVLVLQWIPITFLGVIGSVALVLLGWLALNLHDRVLFGAALAGLGLIVLCTLMVFIQALFLRFRREQKPNEPLECETGVRKRTGYRFGVSSWNPLIRVEISWHLPIAAKAELVAQRASLYEEITARDRALSSEVVRSIRVGDVFGMARIIFRRRMKMDVRIESHCGSVKPQQLYQQTNAGDAFSHPDGKPEGDLIEMRRYVPGDPLKLVLWKLFARSGQLLVRTPEKVVAASKKTMFYLACAADDEPAAGICRAILKNSSLETGMLFGTDGVDEPTSSLSTALDQLARSSSARDQGGTGFSHILAAAAQQDVRACVLFVPPKPGPWLNEVAQNLSQFRGHRQAIVGVDGLDSNRASDWLSWLIDQPSNANWKLAELEETCRRLTDAGADVKIVDRTSGGIRRIGELSRSNAKH